MQPLRLPRVRGLEARYNDVLYAPPRSRVAPAPQPTALVYWGGDVQDYPEVMLSHRDNRNYVEWNLENTARMLSRSFPSSHIVVVRPSRIEYKSFSCYDNFVPSNNAGVPDHTPTHSALHHLQRLLEEVSHRVKAMPASELQEAFTRSLPEDINLEDLHNAATSRDANRAASGVNQHEGTTPAELWWHSGLCLEECELMLVGFSKGCVVLNQLVYEFHYTHTLTPGDRQVTRFISQMRGMCWLDGGHAGGKNTWLTARSLLETLARLDMEIYIHVSPYQVQDEGRPWIGREEKAFTALLKKLGAKVQRRLHCAPGAPQSLQMHFDVLANFCATPPSPISTSLSDVA